MGEKKGAGTLYATVRGAAVANPILRLSQRSALHSADPIELARTAELVSTHRPGGPLLRVRLWGNVRSLLAPDGMLNGSRQTFLRLIDRAGISEQRAKQLMLVGEAVNGLQGRRRSLASLK